MKTRLLGVCFVLVASVAVSAQNPEVAQPPADETVPSAAGPRLELSSTVLDFGEVWQGEEAKGEFVIRNIGTAPLTIAVKSSCGCAVPTKPKSPLAPGESDIMTIQYDTIKRKGEAKQRVTLTTNDPAQQHVRIDVRGRVKPLYSATPADGIFFHRLHSGKIDSRTITFENKYEGPMHLKLAADQDFGPFDISIKELEAGQVYELMATTRPPLPEQVTRVDVILETGLERTPRIKIPVHAYVQPDALCRPSLIRIARQAPVAQEKVVQFVCRVEQAINITKIVPSIEGIEYEIQPARRSTINDEWDTRRIRLKFPPGDQLPQGDVQVVIYTDSPDLRFQKFEIRVEIVDERVRGDVRRGSAPTNPATRPAGSVGARP
ncbi:MAG: DUF1573 domain-containing protein [Planctomycetota bacterium]